MNWALIEYISSVCECQNFVHYIGLFSRHASFLLISTYTVFKLQFPPTTSYNYITVVWDLSVSNSISSTIYFN